MASFKLDLRKTLRAIATAIQDDNADRLLSGVEVDGGGVPPRKEIELPSVGRKRVRVLGVRVKLSQLVGRVGIATGAMLKELTRRANIKIGRAGFKIVPSSPKEILKARVFNAGRNGQEPRPVFGVSGERLASARDQLAKEVRDQSVKAMQQRANDARRSELYG